MIERHIKYRWTNNSTTPGDTSGVLELGYGSGYAGVTLSFNSFAEAHKHVEWIDSAVKEALRQYNSDLANKFSEEAMKYYGRR